MTGWMDEADRAMLLVGNDPPAPPTGDCGSAAFHYHMANPETTVCHGYPIGRGRENAGVRFWHAWVETPDGTVIDRSNGQDVRLSRVLYYAIGRIEWDEVWRYDSRAAPRAALQFGHYGPWDGSEPPVDDDEESSE